VETLDPFAPLFWARVGVAVVCGGAIGMERQLRGKPAGIRTSILICLGTHLFVTLGASFQGALADPTRVLGQVVTGIGFLGAGVIMTQGRLVVGVTSAAVVWLLAAIGAAVALGYEPAAVAITAVTLAVLLGVQWLEHTFVALRRGVHEWRTARGSSDG
jgi:putative Mg2+ transporter-C (MgtC) family protein